jgi:nucleoside-diphosphate-sugar epimerase
MNIVVTGGAGFIGSKLCEKLAAAGHDVVCADVRSLDLEQIDNHPTDVLSAEGVDKLLAANLPVDVVYHLAGPVVETVRKQPAAAFDLQVRGTTNVLEACRLRRVPRVLLASSFYVYAGCPPEWVVNEETVLDVRQVELFGAAKLTCERLVTAFAKSYGLRWQAFRFGSVYGFNPRGGGSNVIRTFLEQGFRREPITVWGPGRRRNQYTLLDDVVDALVRALDPAYDGEVWNLVSPYETTTGQLATVLADAYGFEFVFDEDKPEGPSMAFMVSRKAVTRSLFQPTPLAEGIRQTVEAMAAAGVVALPPQQLALQSRG